MSTALQNFSGKVNASASLASSGTRQLDYAILAQTINILSQEALKEAANAQEQEFGEEAVVPVSYHQLSTALHPRTMEKQAPFKFRRLVIAFRSSNGAPTFSDANISALK